MVLKSKLIFQFARFGIIGVSAAAVHFSIVFMLVESGALVPLVANIVAFLFAFQVSYWGHRCWTFSGTTALHRVAFPRLLLVSSLGFMVNESLFYILLYSFNLPYTLALFIVLTILPVATFIINKIWVFR